jgi:hypothetical protein
MGWSGGTFTRSNGTYSGASVWASDEGASIGIEAARHDTHDQDLAAGVNACLAKNGSNAATADLNMGSFKLTALANGSARNHAASLAQVQDSSTEWGGVATGTANAIAIACTPSPGSYAAGQTFRFIALYANTGAATVNVNALGAKDVYKEVNGALGNLGAGDIAANGCYELTYFTGGGGYFTLSTSKPGAATFTHSFAPDAGSFFTPTYEFLISKSGQRVTVNFRATGTQTSAATGSYTFSVPYALHSTLTSLVMPAIFSVSLTPESGILSLSGTTVTAQRLNLLNFPSGAIHIIAGEFSYLTE